MDCGTEILMTSQHHRLVFAHEKIIYERIREIGRYIVCDSFASQYHIFSGRILRYLSETEYQCNQGNNNEIAERIMKLVHGCERCGSTCVCGNGINGVSDILSRILYIGPNNDVIGILERIIIGFWDHRYLDVVVKSIIEIMHNRAGDGDMVIDYHNVIVSALSTAAYLGLYTRQQKNVLMIIVENAPSDTCINIHREFDNWKALISQMDVCPDDDRANDKNEISGANLDTNGGVSSNNDGRTDADSNNHNRNSNDYYSNVGNDADSDDIGNDNNKIITEYVKNNENIATIGDKNFKMYICTIEIKRKLLKMLYRGKSYSSFHGVGSNGHHNTNTTNDTNTNNISDVVRELQYENTKLKEKLLDLHRSLEQIKVQVGNINVLDVKL